MAKIDKFSYRILYNFLLPFTLIVAFSLRLNFPSFVYFVFALFLPLTVSPPTSKYPGHPHRFICVITFWAAFCLVCQVIFNFVPWENLFQNPVLPTDPAITVFENDYSNDNDSFVDFLKKKENFIPEIDCHPFSRWLRQMGFDRVRPHWSIPRKTNLFASDVIVLICGSLLLFRLKILRYRRRKKIVEPPIAAEKPRRFSTFSNYLKKYGSENFELINNVILTVGFCIVGSVHPSFASIPYFGFFLIIATFWAFDRPITKIFWIKVRRGFLLYSAVHLCLLYIYQLPNVYKSFPQHEFIARVLGLVHYKTFRCDILSWPLPYHSFIWPEYIAPMVLFLFYYLLATQISIIRENEDLEELQTLFSQARGTVAALVIESHNGAKVALGYERKISAPEFSKESEKIQNKKNSVSSAGSISSKKFPKISFAEKLVLRKPEMSKMKNLAKWENLKPLLETIKTQSYVIALIVLMAWSLCYHSWSTFVMLILSFVVWMHPNSQRFYVRLAPFIVIYATILLIFQFIYSLPLSQDELPDEHPAFLRQLGLEKPRMNAPVFDILLKALFNFAFWLALRQTLELQKKPKPGTLESLEKPVVIKEDEESESVSSVHEKPPLFERIKIQISNFWIFLVLALLLLISMRNPVVFYRIVYMAFFLVFLTSFTVSFPFFRKILKIFWLTMIGYCIFVVTLIYTYQFHGIPELYRDYLGMSDDVVKSIGLESISASQLLIRLLTPISFLIFTLIQLNFFHEKMMKITQKWEDDVYGLKLRFLMAKLKLFHRQMNYLESGIIEAAPEEIEQPSEEDIKGIAAKQRIKKVMGEIEKKCKQMLSYRQNFFNIIWRLTEIHIDRVVAFLIVYIAVQEVSSLNLPLIICVAIMLPLETKTPRVCDFICIVSSIIVILKMLFQMEFIKEEELQAFCIDEDLANGTVVFNAGSWFGMHKVESIFDHTKWHIFIVLSLVFRELIKIRQFLHRKQNRLEEPPRGIMFPGIDRPHADEDMTHCFLYFCNYFFYKFGVEICFITSVIAIGIRNDIFAVFYVCWLIFMLTRTRSEQRILWSKYTGFISVCFVLQYFLAIGIPGFACVGYIWDSWDSNLIEWLCLPSFKVPPNAEKLFADFFQLLCVSSQYYAFKLELKHGRSYPGGSNDLLELAPSKARRFLFAFDLSFLKVKSARPLKKSTVPDFISDGKTMLDKLKHVFFMYFYWITLSMIFIAGTTHVTLFAAGYVFGCFLFLWMGYSLFFKPIIVVLKMWDLLIYYNVSVILLKTVLQVVGCVYMSQMYKNFCWLLQLLGIACNKAGYTAAELVDPEILAECDVPHTEAGIFYDNLCFVFLLIQRRIFGSEYFKHVIAELKAQRFFASRGAELIEKINKQEVEVSEAREQEMMDMVDRMVEKISKKHKKSIPIGETPSGDVTPLEELKNENISVKLQDPLVVEVHGLHDVPSPDSTSPVSPEGPPPGFQTEGKPSVTSLGAPRPIYRPHSVDIPRSVQQMNLDKIHRRKSENPRYHQRSQDEESDSWSMNSSEKNPSSARKTGKEGGVKGLGPLQLLNFAIKKGAIKDAVKESNEMEKTHTEMEKEMEKEYGTSDYRQIRKRILKQKARQKAKPDFDEDTFETDALTNFAETLAAPGGPSTTLKRNERLSTMSSDTEDVLSGDEEGASGESEAEQEVETAPIPISKKEKLKQIYRRIKTYIIEYTKMLGIFIGMLFTGTIESLISYLMRLSRDYRYIAYILQEEKRIHKELFDQTMDVDEHLSKKERHQQRAMIREKLQEKYDKSGFLKDEGIRKLHQYVEETEVKEESQAFECPKIEIQHCEDEDNSQKIDGEVVGDLDGGVDGKDSGDIDREIDKKVDEKIDVKVDGRVDGDLDGRVDGDLDGRVDGDLVEDKGIEFNAIHPAIIVHEEEGNDPKIVHYPEIVVPSEATKKELKPEFSLDSFPEEKDHPIQETKEEYLFVRLAIALYYAILSKSELLCYIMIILNHINSASLLSMPLPFLMLCWGTLTVPLPTKTFWITVISYTETMVVIKYAFQFGFFPWNHAAPSLDPFWLPRILGIEKRPKYAAWDLALLMMLFFHRNILMSIGLWRNNGDSEDDDGSSITSSIKEDSRGSNPPSLALPEFGKKTSFPRRLTAISFNSVANKLRKEKIKRKNCNECCTAMSSIEEDVQKSENFSEKSALKITVTNMSEGDSNLTSVIGSFLEFILVDKKVTKVKGFFGQVLNPRNRVPIDVYAPMFLCDIICFMIVIFGFSSFGTDNGAGSVAAYFEENKVPGTLVAMLIIQFVLIVVDRALFLRKFLFGKLFFQLFLVIFVHIWIFFLLPGATDRLFVNNFTCKLWYLVKSFYFLISAKQIRCGYPKFSVGNVLTRNYNYFNYVLKNTYMKVPFLYEMGLLTDWIWKDTSLNLGDWITLHDIYSNIARLKCIRNWEEDFPSPKGVKQRPLIKYGYGGLLLFLIILIIWFPLVLFSMANTVGLRSTPIECTCRLTIAGYQPLFDSTARMGDIQPLTIEEYDELYYTYRMSKTALSYIADYTNLDVVKASINGNSASRWQISPPAREYMAINLNSSLPMSLQFEWSFKRAPDENLQQGIAEDNRIIELPPGDPIRQELIAMINGESTEPILIPDLFPSMVKVPGEGKAEHANALLVEHLRGSEEPIETTFNDVYIELISVDGVEYWRLNMIDPMFDPIRKTESVIRDRLIFYGFVDKVFPKSFSFITGGGILGLYISIVFLLGQYIRGFVIDSMQSIMFEELPNVDRILDLCHKIFFVRDVSRFDLEEALYANLIFLFRSPATLIKWTKERPA